jgi:ABC-type nitrate/sulfonate/bicarbonate transport system permease component
MKRSTNTANRLAPYLTGLCLLVIWELAVRMYKIPEYILPAPTKVFKTLAESYKLLITHTTTTVLEALIGFGVAIAFAFIVAFLLTYIKWLNQAFYPMLIVSQTIPIITLAPLFLIWFGWGILPKIIVVVLVCFFPIVINLINGLNSVDPDLLNLFRSMRASRADTFKMVRLPAAMPAFFSGLKISASYSIMAAVIGEWLGANRGLGFYMTISQKSFSVDQVLAAVIVITFVSLLMVKVIDLAEWLFIPWNRWKSEFDEN